MRYGVSVMAALLLVGCGGAKTGEATRQNIKVNGLEIGVVNLAADGWGAWLVGPSLITPARAKIRAAERKAVEQVSGCRVVSGGLVDSPLRPDYVELTVTC